MHPAHGGACGAWLPLQKPYMWAEHAVHQASHDDTGLGLDHPHSRLQGLRALEGLLVPPAPAGPHGT